MLDGEADTTIVGAVGDVIGGDKATLNAMKLKLVLSGFER